MRPALVQKRDFYLLALLLFLAGFFAHGFGHKDGARMVQIWQHNTLLYEASFNENTPRQSLVLDACPEVEFVIDGKEGCAFVKSNCKDQICVHMGHVHHEGESAACLPNGLILTITGDESYDVVAGKGLE